MTTVKTKKSPPLKRWFRRNALQKISKALVLASEQSSAVGDDILYGLPGVFSFCISYKGECVRLIKEANSFRIMKPSEKSEVLLSIEPLDDAALGDLCLGGATWHKLYAEGRVSFAGKIKYATVFMRVAAEGDRFRMSEKNYQDLYGE